ncbi:exopolysaccharide production repressor protein [Agrobacterium rubi]|uniref:Exopolysaccharide production repressor exox n=2 Tax=Agrobacterium rubi TaxID=28099 RepID=A0AAE7REG2_9HYPH|nr:exopolysaccharide production repressor protein [Agrobacterium rubi]MBP1878785.1 exopolysaccharide production repressor protein [Agrobacterium rubi]NTE88594.1 exopolysaccharide production repressor exox [Agrobacterium rubi]NTF04422.1 exopolysaccharide production repressor exox [Agrobacterium rubi]NTF09955.1 exopolysaccharide production repressor exox [Agrobacterium rubi]NTF21867.1 exopolysaccharide production repressor exox [Agrobacterium rubi]
MYAPRVFISMICALLSFAVATYFIYGSFYTAVVQTILCLIIIQVGYFAGIVFLVAKEKRRMRETLGFKTDAPILPETSIADSITVVAPHRAKLSDF